ncbi:MAG: coproporphyrinogen dehydrogenase HemZ [Clostridia bacterium]|nr:coproporphyrinogen dehydrogenase HemZ [Clostridia bacterium]
MKLNLNGNINRIYVQSLCMIFYHGIKFPVGEENTDGLELTVTLTQNENTVHCTALLMADNNMIDAVFTDSFSDKESEDRTNKIVVGQAVYKVCSEMTGRTSGYGILTGIRPSKVTSELLSSYNEDKTLSILTDRYLVSKEKAELCITVAKNEAEILRGTDDSQCSVYISIPFCPSRCNYCSFISFAGKKLFSLIPNYVKRLCEDIRETFSLIDECGLSVSCIYIGGGTPTVLESNQLEYVLSTVAQCVDVSKLEEYTLEGGRPDTITDEKLRIAKDLGITRISVNPQTLNDYVLERIGRKHTVEEFLEAYKKVKVCGIKNVNTDLIAGLDGDNVDSFKKTIDSIIALDPDNITVHSFSVKNASQIRVDDKDIYEKSFSEARYSVDYAIDRLCKNDYIPYYMYRQKNTVDNLENVGYAKKGSFGLYNVYMMSDAHTVFGIGAGATTKLVKHIDGKTEIKRIFSYKYPYEYLKEKRSADKTVREFFERR